MNIRAELILIVLLSTLVSCGQKIDQTNADQTVEKSKNSTQSLFIDASNFNNGSKTIEALARKYHISLTGEKYLVATGAPSQLREFQDLLPSQLDTFEDEDIVQSNQKDRGAIPQLHREVLYLAKKDFGLIDYWKTKPNHDGRNVIVGLIDDGISPTHSGLQTTSEGKRKFLGRSSRSSYAVLKLQAIGPKTIKMAFLKSVLLAHKATTFFQAEISERRPYLTDLENRGYDLNSDGSLDTIEIAVVKTKSKVMACFDTNVNHLLDTNECVEDFTKSGKYLFWDKKKTLALMVNIDLKKNEIRYSLGEGPSDGHGEGVASVMAGHKIAGRFNGVAPGAQVYDYDLSEKTNNDIESFYMASTFLKGLSWLGKKKVEVVNISYSLFFHSAKTQLFFKKALEELVKKYNFVICFSAGNNGPGLGSLNRRNIYPRSALVTGAFVGQELDEYVHGVTGLPKEGRIVYYSSRGPGPNGGQGPSIISPLASLAHAPPSRGMRAFSGTSSASPALAGFTAAFISALKDHKLKIDATTVANAVRLSGKALPDIPYVFQGRGLPQISKAISIYRDLMIAKRPLYVESEIYGSTGPDDTKVEGLVFYEDELTESSTVRVKLTAKISKLATAKQRDDFLRTTIIRYPSADYSGTSKNWISLSTSQIFFDIDLNQIFKSDSLEHFHEIQIVDSKTNQVLEILPVTFIKGSRVIRTQSFEMELGSEQGKRIHLGIDSETQGLDIKIVPISGPIHLIAFELFDQHFVGSQRKFNLSKNGHFIVNTYGSGHYQLGLSYYKGTAKKVKFKIVVTPIKVRLQQNYASKATPTLNIKSNSTLEGLEYQIVPVSKEVKKILLKYTQLGKGTHFAIDRPGVYNIDLFPLVKSDLSYFIFDCSLKVTKKVNENVENVLNYFSGYEFPISSFDLKDQVSHPVSVHAKCFPFDLVKSPTNALSMWGLRLSIKEKMPPAFHAININGGRNSIKLSPSQLKTMKIGQSYKLYIFDRTSSQKSRKPSSGIKVGTFELIN